MAANGKNLSKIRIRPAVLGDASAVARVWHQGWYAGHAAVLPWLVSERPPLAFEAKAPGVLLHCLVAEAFGDKVVGFTAWHGTELGQLFMEPSWMGAGLAQILLAATEAAMLAEGVKEATLTCVAGNERAREFYLRHGWTERGLEDYPAQVEGGTRPVPVWRLTKQIAHELAGA